MKTRKTLAALMLGGAVLSAAVPTASLAAGTTAAATSQADDAAAATVKAVGGKYYLYNTAGKRITGKKGLYEYPSGSGTYYYFKNTKGELVVKKLIKKGTSYYYAQKDGTLASGFQTVGSYTYYFTPKTLTAAAGWKKIGKKYYYFNTKCIQLTGLQTIKNKIYFLNPAQDGARATGWAKVAGKWEYFNKKGVRKTGLIKDAETGTYYFINKKGVRQTGLVTYKGYKYYFDKNEGYTAAGVKIGGAMATGWKKIKGKTYYFTASGKAVTGWLTKGKKKYYFNSNGVMQTGSVTIGSKVYNFNKKTGVLKSTKTVTGAYSIKVNQTTNVVTIYRGTTPIKAMLCSVGLNNATPDGTFSLSNKRHWHALFGNCWGQYTCQITGNILFHSVFYYTYKDNHSLATAEFRKLGQAASHGCVRLNCADAYYIYTYCPVGTKVTIFHGSSKDDPLGKPTNKYANWTGNYDPTDPITND